MVEITEKEWDTTVRNPHIQDAEKLFFMSSWFINFHYIKPFVSNILNLNHVSLIVGDATDKNTIIDVSLTTGLSGRYNATVISRISSSIIKPPVLKFADADPGNGNGAHQYGADNQNNANGNGAAYHNAPVFNMIANGGNHGGGIGNGNGGNHNNGIGNGYGVDPIGIWIHRTELYSSGRIVRPIIFTNIFAYHYNSWIEFKLAINVHLLQVIGLENEGGFEVEKVMGFGRWGVGHAWQFYRPLDHPWNIVKWLITDVLLYKAMFEEEPFLREMPYENGNVRIIEGGVFETLVTMDWFAPVQVYQYDEIGGEEDGNGNGDDGGNGNGVDGDGHGGNGNGVDGGNGNGVYGDDDVGTDNGDHGGKGNGVDGYDDGGNGNGVDGDDDVGNGNGVDGGNGNGVDGDDHGGNGNGVDGDDHGGNGNEVEGDGAHGNGVDGDDHGQNGSVIDVADDGHGSDNDGDDGGTGSGNGGNFREGRPGILICCSMVLSFSLALAIVAYRNK